MCGIAGFLAKRDGRSRRRDPHRHAAGALQPRPRLDGPVALRRAARGRRMLASIWAGDDGGPRARDTVIEAIDRHGARRLGRLPRGLLPDRASTPEDATPERPPRARRGRRAQRVRASASSRSATALEIDQVHGRRPDDLRPLVASASHPVHPRDRPRADGDRVARGRQPLAPVLGAAVPRRHRRPQRPRHELLQEPPHLRDAGLHLPDRERHRVRGRLPRRADGARADARRGCAEVDRRSRRLVHLPRARPPTASASRATASRRSRASSPRRTTGSPSSPRGSRSQARSATGSRSTRTSCAEGRRGHGRGDGDVDAHGRRPGRSTRSSEAAIAAGSASIEVLNPGLASQPRRRHPRARPNRVPRRRRLLLRRALRRPRDRDRRRRRAGRSAPT